MKTSGKVESINFTELFRNKKIPILTLDENWLALFPKEACTASMLSLRETLASLMKQQSRCIEEVKTIKLTKKNLMQDIISKMNASDSERSGNKNQRLIKELNDRLQAIEDELEEIPRKIKAANDKLMAESLNICFTQTIRAIREQDALLDEIEQLKAELRDLTLQRQDLTVRVERYHGYMENLLGKKVTEDIVTHALK